MLRFWISQQGFSHPSDKKLTHVFTDLINAAEDKQPTIEWDGAEIRRYQNLMYIMAPLAQHNTSEVINWNIENAVTLQSISLQLQWADVHIEPPDSTRKFQFGFDKVERELTFLNVEILV